MSFFNEYPYRNLTDLNLDYLLRQIGKVTQEVTEFVTLNTIKYADPISWNITTQYGKNTVVIDPMTGTAYLSSQPVPIGVALSDTHYWSVIFDLGRFITLASQNFANSYESVLTTTATMETVKGGWIVWDSVLYEALNDIHVGDRYVIGGNIKKTTVEDFYDRLAARITQEIADRIAADGTLQGHIDAEAQARQNADGTLQDHIDAEAQARQAADGTLQNHIDAEAQARQDADGTLQNHIDAEAQARQDADGVINNTIGRLNDLATTDKSSIVKAINETFNLGRYSSNVINVKQYGAVGDGVTDDHTAITAALTEAIQQGAPLYFPKGVFYVASPIIIPACDGLTIIGSGRNTSTIKGACVMKSNDSVLTDHVTIANLTFRSVEGSTSALLDFTGHFYRSLICNCAFYDWYTAVHIWYYLDSKIIACEFNNPLSVADSCIIVSRNADGSSGANLTVAYCLLQGWQNEDDTKIYGKVGVEIRDGDAVYMDNVDMGRFIENNVKIDAQYRSDNHNFHNCYFDVTKTGHGLLITGGAQMQHISVNNCWFASTSYIDRTNGAGIYCNADNLEDMRVSDNRFINISGSGVHVKCSHYIGTIENNQFTNIGLANINNNNFGIYLETPITVANAAVVKNNYIYNSTGSAVAMSPTTLNVIFDGNLSTNCELVPNAKCRTYRNNNPVVSITAAQDLSGLNLSYDTYLVTGTTAIQRLPDTVNGKVITLLFNSATPINTSGNIRLTAPFTATGGSSLTLVSFAHGWTEVGRGIV